MNNNTTPPRRRLAQTKRAPVSPFNWEGWEDEKPRLGSFWFRLSTNVRRFVTRSIFFSSLARLCPRARVEVDYVDDDELDFARTVRLLTTPRVQASNQIILMTPQIDLKEIRFNPTMDIRMLTPPSPGTAAEHQVRVRAREAVDVAIAASKLAISSALSARLAASTAGEAHENFLISEEAARQAHLQALCVVRELKEEEEASLAPIINNHSGACQSCFEPFSMTRPQLTLSCGHSQQECIECACVTQGDEAWCFDCNQEKIVVLDIAADDIGRLSEQDISSYDELEFSDSPSFDQPISPPPLPTKSPPLSTSKRTKKNVLGTVSTNTPPQQLKKSPLKLSSVISEGLSTPSDLATDSFSCRTSLISSPPPLPSITAHSSPTSRGQLLNLISTNMPSFFAPPEAQSPHHKKKVVDENTLPLSHLTSY